MPRNDSVRTHRAAGPGAFVRTGVQKQLAGWFLLLIGAGLVLIGLTGEAWFRLTTPFMSRSLPLRFVPGVGLLIEPDAEVRWTNRLDFWTITRTNRWGFPDRSPPRAPRPGCRVAMIGDSMTGAIELPVADKFHVRLEELAARRLPRLAVTTVAFGKGGTGQINQLPYYDEYARRLQPRLLVLVFLPNDFIDNFPLLAALETGLDPDRMPYVTATRDTHGRIVLRPPDPEYRYLESPRSSRPRSPWYRTAAERVTQASWFATWLAVKFDTLAYPWDGQVLGADPLSRTVGRAELLRRRPGYAELLDGWRPPPHVVPDLALRDVALRNLPPVYAEALRSTAFALDEFKQRADRDGAALVILATHRMKAFGPRPFEWLSVMAAARGIPVIDQYDYILRQGAEPVPDAQWRHDPHWSAAGHRWAAEALLEYLVSHPEACGAPPAGRGRSPMPASAGFQPGLTRSAVASQ